MTTLTYAQEDIIRLVEADVRSRASPTSVMIHVLRRETPAGESRIEVQVDLDPPPPPQTAP